MLQACKTWLRKNLFFLVTILISCGVLLFFLFTTDGITTLGTLLTQLKSEWLVFACLSAVAGFFLEGYVLHLFCTHLQGAVWRFRESFCVAMTGLLYSAVTPFATGGQPMQIYSMKRMGMDMGKAGSAIAVKTLVYQIVMVLYSMFLVVLKLPFFQSTVSDFSFLTVIGLITNSAFITLVILFMLSARTTDKILRFFLRFLYRLKICRKPIARYKSIHSQLEMFHDSAKTMGKCWRLYLKGALLTVVQITINGMIPYFIFRSFNLHAESASLLTMVAAQAFVSMVSAFVPLPGASGGAEGSFYLFFGMFFGSTIIPAILIWRIITYYSNIVVGGVSTYFSQKLYRDS